MKKFLLVIFFVLSACAAQRVIDGFEYQELKTSRFKVASWKKITDNTSPIRIYIEGEGHAHQMKRGDSDDALPHTFVRDLAFNDPNSNVVYLARPCQYVEEDDWCSPSDWGSGRFSKTIVDSLTEAIQQITNGRPVILIGYSESAMISGLIISRHPDMRVQKWMTIAGVLNHSEWTKHLKMHPLLDSLELTSMPNVVQMHFVGGQDTTVPVDSVAKRAPMGSVFQIPHATHNTGFEAIYPLIYE